MMSPYGLLVRAKPIIPKIRPTMPMAKLTDKETGLISNLTEIFKNPAMLHIKLHKAVALFLTLLTGPVFWLFVACNSLPIYSSVICPTFLYAYHNLASAGCCYCDLRVLPRIRIITEKDRLWNTRKGTDSREVAIWEVGLFEPQILAAIAKFVFLGFHLQALRRKVLRWRKADMNKNLVGRFPDQATFAVDVSIFYLSTAKMLQFAAKLHTG